MHTTDPNGLREALRGMRALLLDLDGVVVVAGQAVPGSVDAIAELERRAMPYRIVTNTSLVSRATLSRFAAKEGREEVGEGIRVTKQLLHLLLCHRSETAASTASSAPGPATAMAHAGEQEPGRPSAS